MNAAHPNFLVYLNVQAQAGLWDYAPQRTWLEERGMRVAYTDHLTNYIVLIQADETQSEIEDAIRDTKYGYDSFRVVPVSDFQWPSAVPDDEKTLRQWLEQRPEWEEWRAAHL